ncbi:MAG: acyl-CoA dehydrogenase family protein [Hydrogenibacillus schlegelii]|uniref:Acyl-CoA dehydrogenase family protein n=1 Tax=Hydrogenibacillus schlegelii TaxID=1484 RepID=A0A947CWW2_HYDSH|nr:acyl-CoA dehydrogenase family protein [Hydrogenibacillus schlegelii]
MVQASLSGPVHPLVRSILIPEAKTSEHQLIETTARSFVEERVLPHLPALEAHDDALLKALYREAGELGLAGVDVPEAYGGLELDALSVLLVTEALGEAGGFGVSFNIHSGVGTQPILFFGTEEQRRRYVPDLAAGVRIGAYALTEPNAGSDALSGRTRARWDPAAGVFRLSGEKQWISNARVADVFIVFARLEGEGLTAFIVERGSPGLSVGPEERKMGIHASPTASLILDEVPVPEAGLLGAPGEGHRVALSVLNLARHKMAVYALGQSRRALRLAVRFAKERKQFGRPIAEFGLIREKLAEMFLRHAIAESMVYRTGGELDGDKKAIVADLSADGGAHPSSGTPLPEGVRPSEAGRAAVVRRRAATLSQRIAACALNKVLATEVQGENVDEAVQIHGGYGYMAEYEVERLYRDARITRIFEGTNEINRLAAVRDLIGKDGAPKPWPSPETAAAAAGDRRPFADSALASAVREGAAVAEAVLYAGSTRFSALFEAARRRFGPALPEAQAVVRRLADAQAALYALESTLARTVRAQAAGAGLPADAAGALLALAGAWASRTLRTNMDELERHLGASSAAPPPASGGEGTAPVDVIRAAETLADYVLSARL